MTVPRLPECGQSLPLESDANTTAENDRGIDHRELTGGVEGSLDPGVDDLQIESRVEPGRECKIVIRLKGVLALQTEVEPLPEKRKKLVAELVPCSADPERVVGPTRHDAVAADPAEERVLDGVRVSVGGAEPEEDPDAMMRVAVRLPQVLVEGIAHRPAAAALVRRLGRDRKVWKEPRENG